VPCKHIPSKSDEPRRAFDGRKFDSNPDISARSK
jgi:hypothetical protein